MYAPNAMNFTIITAFTASCQLNFVFSFFLKGDILGSDWSHEATPDGTWPGGGGPPRVVPGSVLGLPVLYPVVLEVGGGTCGA